MKALQYLRRFLLSAYDVWVMLLLILMCFVLWAGTLGHKSTMLYGVTLFRGWGKTGNDDET